MIWGGFFVIELRVYLETIENPHLFPSSLGNEEESEVEALISKDALLGSEFKWLIMTCGSLQRTALFTKAPFCT